MSPEGLITSEFDDAAIIDSDVDAVALVDDDPDDLAELELVVVDVAAVTVAGDDEVLRPVAGAEELISRLRAIGVAVALTTGQSRAALDSLLDVVGWRGLADLALTPAEAGRGRPYPDLPLTALLRTGGSSVDGMVVVGSTPGDIASGLAAGAGLVVGVLTGAREERALMDAGADAVVTSITELAELLGLDDLEVADAFDDELDALDDFALDDAELDDFALDDRAEDDAAAADEPEGLTSR